MPKVRNLTTRLKTAHEALDNISEGQTPKAMMKSVNKAAKIVKALYDTAQKVEAPKTKGTKKPLNAYMQFAAKHREEVKKTLAKENNGKVDVTQVAKELGRLWRQAKENNEVPDSTSAKKAARK